MRRHRRLPRDNTIIEERTASLIVADANISLFHSPTLGPNHIRYHCEGLIKDMVHFSHFYVICIVNTISIQ
jgi:hypothetical protein